MYNFDALSKAKVSPRKPNTLYETLHELFNGYSENDLCQSTYILLLKLNILWCYFHIPFFF